MDNIQDENRNISAEKAIKLLQTQGVRLSPENAKLVLDFLYLLAEVFYNRQAKP